MSNEESEATKVNLEALKQPKVLIAGAIAALGGLLYAGDGFTVEFSTCTSEKADSVEEADPDPEAAPEPVPEVEPEPEEEAE